MIFVYEDEGCRRLEPLTCFRPAFDLLCGRMTLLDRVRRLHPRTGIALVVRQQLVDVTREKYPLFEVNGMSVDHDLRQPMLFLLARAFLRQAIPHVGPEETFIADGEIIGFRTAPGHTGNFPLTADGIARLHLPECKVDAAVIRYPWDVMTLNESELQRDPPRRRPVRLTPGVDLMGRRLELYVDPFATIEPGVVLDTRNGPIFVEPRAQIRAGSVVTGPCFVGAGTILDSALIRPGCSFGPDCRIGGEVEASVFLGRTNKHHEGFIGHSVIGEWVNLGALTTNSDLRNDYGEVKVTLNGREHNSGICKLGCIIGDHAKTAIGTLLNTGAVVGCFANWFEPGLSPRSIPPFAWGNRGQWRLDDALETARIVMSRRGVELSPAYEQLVRWHHGEMGEERE